MPLNRLLLVISGTVVLCMIGQALWMDAALGEMRSELVLARENSHLQFSKISGEVAKLVTGSDGQSDAMISGEEPVFKTAEQAREKVRALADKPTAESFARVLSEIDGWLVTPQDEKKVEELKATLIFQLRNLVKTGVNLHLERALQSPSSATAMSELNEAQRILPLYPMSNERSVINEATQLSTRQTEVATRLEALRRQRYNRWALDEVERANKHYNDNVSRWNPLNDNKSLLSPLIAALAPIDPAFLEPAVVQLYVYIVERTKRSLSEPNRFDFARGLTDPSVSRKTLGDF